MTDRNFTQPSEHEKAVRDERARQTGEDGPEELTGEAAGETGTTPYEAEVEAEQRGTTAGDMADEIREDEQQPLDSGYKPRTG
ncbi:MAG TPA: hypothetical protein VF071_03060 [Candidatus Limnocylindria bacterium]